MTTLTVTAAQGGSSVSNGMALTLKVVTGAAAVQNGATAASATVTVPELAITPHANGSWVYGALVSGFSSAAYTPAANTTFSQNQSDVANDVAYGAFRGTAVTAAGTPVTIGATAPTLGSGDLFIALAEILAAGTLAEDASTPAPVWTPAAEFVTTAAFTPPPGSLLVAIAAANTTGGTDDTIAVSNTGPALAWGQLAIDPALGIAGIFAAFVPAAPGAAAAPGDAGHIGVRPGELFQSQGRRYRRRWG